MPLTAQEFETLLQNNPFAMTNKIGNAIRSGSLSIPLYENMNYIINKERSDLSLFGGYSYSELKSKDILESISLEFLHKLRGFPNINSE